MSLSTGVAYFRVDTVHHFHNTKELGGRDRISWTCLADTTHYATRNSNNDIHTHKYTHTHSHTHTHTHTHAYKQLGNNREISITPPSACMCMCLCVCVCVCVCVLCVYCQSRFSPGSPLSFERGKERVCGPTIVILDREKKVLRPHLCCLRERERCNGAITRDLRTSLDVCSGICLSHTHAHTISWIQQLCVCHAVWACEHGNHSVEPLREGHCARP